MRTILASAATFFLIVSGDALAAAWHEASSDHFVIYADESEKDIRKYSDRLERYYSAMTFVLPSKKIKPSPSNRVTIYVVRSERIVRKLYGGGSDARYLQGFYIPRASGPVAFVPSKEEIRQRSLYTDAQSQAARPLGETERALLLAEMPG